MTAPDEANEPVKPRRRIRPLGLLLALVASAVLLCCGGTTAFFLGGLGGDAGESSALGPGCGLSGPIDLSKKLPRIGLLGE